MNYAQHIQDLDVAKAFGYANHQKAIYDVNNDKSIHLD
jgi:hypothetical protein